MLLEIAGFLAIKESERCFLHKMILGPVREAAEMISHNIQGPGFKWGDLIQYK